MRLGGARSSSPVNSSRLVAAGPSRWVARSSAGGRIDDAELGRGDPEPGVGGGDAQIAVDGDRAPAADAVARDVRDGRLGKPGQRILGGAVDVGERRSSALRATFNSVMSAPAQKCWPDPRNDHDSH